MPGAGNPTSRSSAEAALEDRPGALGPATLDRRAHGGLIGVRDENGLESALARARQRWAYEPETDPARVAAAYAFGICSNHTFRDGNKRVAFLAAVIFLGLNGLDLIAPETEVVEKMLALASNELDEDGVAAWYLHGRR